MNLRTRIFEYIRTVTIAIHPSIVGTDPIRFFFMNDILAESFTILNWTNRAKMPIIMLKFKYEFALIYISPNLMNYLIDYIAISAKILLLS